MVSAIVKKSLKTPRTCERSQIRGVIRFYSRSFKEWFLEVPVVVFGFFFSTDDVGGAGTGEEVVVLVGVRAQR